jgi:hypothetical protein
MPEGLELWRAVRSALPDYTGYTSEEQMSDWRALELAVATSPQPLHREDFKARLAHARAKFRCDHNRAVSSDELVERLSTTPSPVCKANRGGWQGGGQTPGCDEKQPAKNPLLEEREG